MGRHDVGIGDNMTRPDNPREAREKGLGGGGSKDGAAHDATLTGEDQRRKSPNSSIWRLQEN